MEINQKIIENLEKSGQISQNSIDQLVFHNSDELLGDHLGSKCEFLTVHFKSKEPVLNLFIKRFFSKNESHTQVMKQMNGFGKESGFYNILLEDMKKFCIDKLGSDEISEFWPKFYYADEEMLILENLNSSNEYFSIDKLTRQDLEQAELTLKILAKFHAISYLMIGESGGKMAFEEKYPFTKETMYVPSGRDNFGGFMEPVISAIIHLLGESDIENSKEIHKKLRKFDGKCFETEMAIIQSSNHLFQVVNHGDLWTTNQKFKCLENGQLVHMKLFDMQQLRVTSPIVELGYYFYTSIQQSVLQDHFIHLLKIYHVEIKNHVEKLKGNFPYTFEQFFQEFRSNAVYGLYYGIFSIGAMHFLPHFNLENSSNYISDFSKSSIKFIQENPEIAEIIIKHVIALTKHFEEFQML